MLGTTCTFAGLAARRGGPYPLARFEFTGTSLPGGVTLTRTSPALRVNAAGQHESLAADIARFDHDPLTLATRGLLIEPAATNLLLHAADFSEAAWTRSAASLSGGSVTGPEGTSLPGWSLGDGYFYQDFATTNGAQYTTSIWIRANKTATIGLRNLSNSFASNVSIILGTSWQRFEVTGLADATSSRFLLDNRAEYGFGTTGLEVYLWAAQVEAGATATSPVLSAASQASRAADQPGISGWSGSYDIRLTYDDLSREDLGGQSLSTGWWPTQSRPHLRSLAIHLAGTLV
ncbi:hypothetical protein [Pseudooceanicola marinus]|uniref:phage head spike fiber domain-containing protein n=1 Tax=Pseudooceanicola marinus TaxID=396013 RepID=UPI001CD5FB25|nr:hypothetical protein [Pseudooceanicola marinus]MCA1338150.1 hypothetical protein [Pseudooceanicola marinus]